MVTFGCVSLLSQCQNHGVKISIPDHLTKERGETLPYGSLYDTSMSLTLKVPLGSHLDPCCQQLMSIPADLTLVHPETLKGPSMVYSLIGDYC